MGTLMKIATIEYLLFVAAVHGLSSVVYVGTTKANSKDVVGSAGGTCYMEFTLQAASKACDFNMLTYFQGKLPYPVVPTEFEKAFYIQFASAVQIRSFMGDVSLLGAIVDVFVSNGSLVREDSRYLCRAGVFPNGVFNCALTLKGTHLVFWPLISEEPGKLVFREVRAWSKQDLAGAGTVVNGAGSTFLTSGSLQELTGPTLTYNYVVEFTASSFFYIDLGSEFSIEDVYVVTENTSSLAKKDFMVSFGTTSPTVPYLNCFVGTFQSTNDEEWYYSSTLAPARYVMIGKSSDCTITNSEKLRLRKVAIFATDCDTSTPTVTLLTTYPLYEYKLVPLSISWPSFSITPANCFALENLIFKDENNNDLVLDGTVKIDWVLQTITYYRLVAVIDPYITMYAVFTTEPSFTTAGTQIAFDMSCVYAVIQPQPLSLPSDYQIVQLLPNAQISLSFPMHQDDAGITALNPLKCGLKSYLTSVPWATVQTPADLATQNFNLVIETNDYNLAGPQSFQLTVKFSSAPSTSTIVETINVNLLHPCKVSVITTTQTISPISYSVGDTATIRPFTAFSDSVSSAYAIPTLCGLVYSLSLPADALTFGVTLVGSSISVVTSDLNLIGQQVSLNLFADAIPQQDTPSPLVPFTVSILDPCLTSAVQLSFVSLDPISVITSDPAETRTFPLDAVDSKSVLLSIPNFCGPILYQIFPIYSFVSFAPGIITVQTDLLSDVGTYVVTLDAYLQNYPSATHSQVAVTIKVIDSCGLSFTYLPTKLIDVTLYANSGKIVSQKFLPAVNSSELVTGQCGPRIYTIVESMPQNFASIIPPLGDKFVYEWELRLVSKSIVDVGIWQMTLRASLQDYPAVLPAEVTFKATVLEACINTTILQKFITPIFFTIGDFAPKKYLFSQFEDSDAKILKQSNFCGPRVYELTDDLPFISIIEPKDPWTEKYEIYVNTTNRIYLGEHHCTLKVSLQNYPGVTSLLAEFIVTITDLPNNLPFFQPKLPDAATILMTREPEPWSLELPAIKDFDYLDKLTLTCNLGYAGNFVQLEGTDYLSITDISKGGSTAIRSGMFMIMFTIDDERDKVDVPFTLIVIDPDEQADEQKRLADLYTISVDAFNQTDGDALEEDQTTTENMFDWQALFAKMKAGLSKEEIEHLSPLPPTPHIQKISEKGIVFIDFASEIFVVPNLEMINNGTIAISSLHREMAIQKLLPVLQVEVIAGIQSNETALAMRWNVTSETETRLAIQLYFDEPLMVSTEPFPDSLRVTFNDPSIFIGKNGLVMPITQKGNFILQRELPLQLELSSKSISSAIETAASASKTVIVINFISNLVMSASLQSLWNMINTQQIIIQMPLLAIVMPANAQILFNQIMKIAAFDIINVDSTINKLLNLNETEPLSPNFRKLGFESIYITNNMGSLLIAFILYPLLFIVLALLEPCISFHERIAKVYENIRGVIFYDYFVSMMTESYSILSLCCLIGFNKISFDSYGEIVQTCVNFAFFGLIIIYPFVISYKTIKGWSRIDELREMYGSYFEELRIATGPNILVYNNYFLFRRLIVALVLVFTRDMLFLQIMIMDFTIIAQVIINGHLEIFETRFKHNMEYINETLVMMTLYCCVCFSSFVPDPKARFDIGYFCCFFVALQLAINLFFIFKQSLSQMIFSFRIWWHRRSMKRQAPAKRAKMAQRQKRKFKEVEVEVPSFDAEIARLIEIKRLQNLSQIDEGSNESGEESKEDHHSWEEKPPTLAYFEVPVARIEEKLNQRITELFGNIDEVKANTNQEMDHEQELNRRVNELFGFGGEMRIEENVEKRLYMPNSKATSNQVHEQEIEGQVRQWNGKGRNRDSISTQKPRQVRFQESPQQIATFSMDGFEYEVVDPNNPAQYNLQPKKKMKLEDIVSVGDASRRTREESHWGDARQIRDKVPNKPQITEHHGEFNDRGYATESPSKAVQRWNSFYDMGSQQNQKMPEKERGKKAQKGYNLSEIIQEDKNESYLSKQGENWFEVEIDGKMARFETVFN